MPRPVSFPRTLPYIPSLHASLLYCTACSDSLFFETLTIAPGTGSYETDAYYASSTYVRSSGIHPAPNGYTLPSEGYEVWLGNNMPPLPPNSAGYPARRLAEIEPYKLTQKQLHANRMGIVADDPWLQSMVPQYGGPHGWTNHSLTKLMEEAELQGKPIAHKYLHALIPRAPSMPRQRQLHDVHHEHTPPNSPPSPPPGAHHYYFPTGIVPDGWAPVAMWGGEHDVGQTFGAPASAAEAYAMTGAARVKAPSAWEAMMAEVLNVPVADVHANVVGDVVQYLVDVNATTRAAVLGSIDNAYFKDAIATAAHVPVLGVGRAHELYHSHGLVPVLS